MAYVGPALTVVLGVDRAAAAAGSSAVPVPVPVLHVHVQLYLYQHHNYLTHAYYASLKRGSPRRGNNAHRATHHARLCARLEGHCPRSSVATQII